jgi:hypothetical protein
MRNFLHFKKAFHVALFCVLLLAAGLTNADAQTGAINGVFAVGENSSVVFSQGNLQYIGSASTPYWKFADHQWDCLGTTTGQDSDSPNVDRDLFGWGTSGYNHGATCYQPWSTSTSYSDYYAYGNSQYNLFDQTGQADWGYNAISNGGNQENSGWRTMTKEEWDYLFNIRATSSDIRYAKATVNNVNGVILLPDDWQTSYYSLNSTNTSGASFSTNVITATQWNTLQQHGAVFLPAAGIRNGTSVNDVGSYGLYWSASCSNIKLAYYVYFGDEGLNANSYYSRYYGRSVRLVRAVENDSFGINATPDPAEGGAVSGAGAYQAGSECTLTAIANEGYSFVSWTEDGEEVSADAVYSFTVIGDRTLVAHFASTFNPAEHGYTTYDWQSNGGARTWTHLWPDGKVNFAYTTASVPGSYSDRGTGIVTYDAAGDSWVFSVGRVENERTGFGSIAQYGSNGLVVAAHTNVDCRIYIIPDKDNIAQNLEPVSIIDDGIEPSWPAVMTSGSNRQIIHLLVTAYPNVYTDESEVEQPMVYYRSTDGGATWDKQKVVLPYMDANYCRKWDSNGCYWMETTDDNCLALVVNNAWSDGMVLYSYDDGETWERKVFYKHPDPFGSFDEPFYFPRWTSCQWDSQHRLHVLYAFIGVSGSAHSYTEYLEGGGVAYWNETMPYQLEGNTESDIPGNLTPGRPFVMDHDYLSNDIQGSVWYNPEVSHEMWPEYMGYLPPLTDDGDPEDPYMATEFNIQDFSKHGAFHSGVSAFPVLCMVPGTDEMVAVWSALDENHTDDKGNYYYKLFASYSNNGGVTWSPMVHLTNDLDYAQNEFVFNQAVVIGRKLVIASQTDNQTGSYLMGDDSDAYDNYYQGLVFDIESLFDTTPATQFSITVEMNDAEMGSVTGEGMYYENGICMLTATPNTKYLFVNWAEDGEVVSTDATYGFKVTGERHLVANFEPSTEVFIDLLPGWNWISYLLKTETPIEEALINLIPEEGDMIKEQNSNCTFINGQWNGTLTTMKPGKGYIYLRQGTATTFTYPDTQQE